MTKTCAYESASLWVPTDECIARLFWIAEERARIRSCCKRSGGWRAEVQKRNYRRRLAPSQATAAQDAAERCLPAHASVCGVVLPNTPVPPVRQRIRQPSPADNITFTTITITSCPAREQDRVCPLPSRQRPRRAARPLVRRRAVPAAAARRPRVARRYRIGRR